MTKAAVLAAFKRAGVFHAGETGFTGSSSSLTFSHSSFGGMTAVGSLCSLDSKGVLLSCRFELEVPQVIASESKPDYEYCDAAVALFGLQRDPKSHANQPANVGSLQGVRIRCFWDADQPTLTSTWREVSN